MHFLTALFVMPDVQVQIQKIEAEILKLRAKKYRNFEGG